MNTKNTRRLQKIGFSLLVSLPTKMIIDLEVEKGDDVEWKKTRSGWRLVKANE